eukprot:gnl/MRDRNA2_/MRDRNA2_34505_c0_seq1.p1 gnl/MRDRNA2_/MRDRNA2_34505_c0~~gnl/MRDRNA2_/MRDRNA2_34505_c0_seq1.p1  ORF type:complete len:418 (+),score=65.58 gnl/MRDRNA2_/MRDRNA2_34505_c0_seq1:109-1254(+)
MPPIQKGSTVAVTGAGGYLGSWIVKTLLDRGYRVRACVRSADDKRNDFLRQMPGFPTGRLTIHSCDMCQQGAFDQAFLSCQAVVHAAADPDVPLEKRPDEYEKNSLLIVQSIQKSSTITRVIYTSSVAAIAGDTDIAELRRRPVIDEARYPNAENALGINGYVIGKLRSERVFFDGASGSGGRWDMFIVNPSDIIGPVLSKHHVCARKAFTPWHCHIARIVEGSEFSQNFEYRPWWIVDVRDTAEAHVRLLESTHVSFEVDACHRNRYFVCSTNTIKVEDIGSIILKLLPEAHLAINGSAVPVDEFGPAYLMTVSSTESEVREVWSTCSLQNQKICKDVAMVFRPLEDSLRDCVESLITVAGIQPKRADEPKAKRQCVDAA